MSRVWMLILALSIGLNAGLLWDEWEDRRERADSGEHVRYGPGPRGAEGAGRFRRGPERGGPFPKAMMERRMADLGDRLGLDPGQRDRMRDVFTDAREDMESRRTRSMELREAIQTEFSNDEIDATKLKRLVGELRTNQAALDSLVAEIMLREASILTPDQRRRHFGAMPWPEGVGGRSGRPGRRGPGIGDGLGDTPRPAPERTP